MFLLDEKEEKAKVFIVECSASRGNLFSFPILIKTNEQLRYRREKSNIIFSILFRESTSLLITYPCYYSINISKCRNEDKKKPTTTTREKERKKESSSSYQDFDRFFVVGQECLNDNGIAECIC